MALVQPDQREAFAIRIELQALKERCALFKSTNDSLVGDMQALSKRNCELEDGMLVQHCFK